MKILLLAPHPFYQERGTPIALDLLLQTLSSLGHNVDVVTFAEGQERVYDNVNFYRVSGPLHIRDVGPGFSLKKLYFDFFLMLKFLRLFFSRSYDVVHAGEEAAFIAMIFCPLKGVPFVYDMDSSMVTQILDKAPALTILEKPLRWLESLPARFARIVVPCCDALAEDVKPYRRSASKPTESLKDISLLDKSRTKTLSGETLIDWLPGSVWSEGEQRPKIAMYIGNLESYQGIDLMLEGAAESVRSGANLLLVVIGGEDEHITHYQEKAAHLQIADATFFLGKRPVDDLYALMLQADIMLSPRTQGVNTPMKVYSYLDSGKPVLATRLPTHTQVMNDEIAMLVEPDAQDFSRGLKKLLDEPEQAVQIAENALSFVAREHSLEAFQKRAAYIYGLLT